MSDSAPINWLSGGASISRPAEPARDVRGGGEINHGHIRRHITEATRTYTQEQMLRTRDNAGPEMAYLAKLMNDPDANIADVEKHLHELTGVGSITPEEAFGILRTLPQTDDSNDVRQWAKAMFAAVMHAGVHAAAAYPHDQYPGKEAPVQAQPATAAPGEPQQAAPIPQAKPALPEADVMGEEAVRERQ